MMPIREKTFWLDTVEMPVPAAREWPTRVDVAVIGAGLTGLKLGANALIARYGRDVARRMYAASLASIACVEQIVREENIDCDFARCGHLEVACKAKHFEEFQNGVEVTAREFGHTLRIVPKEKLTA